jgi:hypothetical protein
MVGLVVSLAAPAQVATAAVTPAKPAVVSVSSAAVVSTVGASTPLSASIAPSYAALAAASLEAGCLPGTFRAGPGRDITKGGPKIWGGPYVCKRPDGKLVGFYCTTPYVPTRTPNNRQLSTVVNSVTKTSADPLDEVLALRGTSLQPGGANYGNVDMQHAMRIVVTYYSGYKTLAASYLKYANAAVKGYYNKWIQEADARAGARIITVSKPSPAWNVGVTSEMTAQVWFSKPNPDKVINNVGISTKVTGAAVKVSAGTNTGTKGAVIKTKPIKWGSFTTTLATTTKFPANKVIRYWSTGKGFKTTSYQQYVGPAPLAPISKVVTGSTAPAPAKFVGDCPGCDGHAFIYNPEEVCNKTGSTQSFAIKDNDAQRPEVTTLAPGECAAAKSIKWKVLHGHSWQVFTWLSANTADKRAVTTKQVVDCPPWPVVEQKFGFNCFDGTFSLSGTAIPDRAGRLIVNGQVTPIVAGGSNSFTTSVDCSKANVFKFSIGSQRANGTWNDSPTLTLDQPALALAS